MKVVSQNFEKNGSGNVTLIPEESEDLWHLYNLVVPGDRVRANTFRLPTHPMHYYWNPIESIGILILNELYYLFILTTDCNA